MTQLWHFPPLQPYTEIMEWKTDVIRAQSAEQRIALRTEPRRTFQLNHIMRSLDYSAARAMAYQAETFIVPDWSMGIDGGQLLAGESVEAFIDYDSYDYSDGGYVFVSQGSAFEATTITISSNSLFLDSLINSYSNARIRPAYLAQLPGGLQSNIQGGDINNVSVNFEAYGNSQFASISSYPTYRSMDVLTVCPIIASEQFAQPINWELITVDNQTGIPSHTRIRGTPDETFVMRWHVSDRDSMLEVIHWIHSRKGRQKAFWLPSWVNDLQIAVDIGASDTSIYIDGLVGFDGLHKTDFDIEIAVYDGTKYRRQVSGFATNSNNAQVELMLSSSLGAAYAVDKIKRISFLRCVRFNADRIALQHYAGTLQVSVPCIEIPVPG